MSESNTGPHNPNLPITRKPHSVSDSSRARGRTIFRPRRSVRVRYQSTNQQHHGPRSSSSPPDATYITSPIKQSSHVQGANDSAVEMHYNCETDWMDDFEPGSAVSGPGKQHKSFLARDRRSRRDIPSRSEYLSKDASLPSKDARRDVSPLQMSEVGISEPPRKVCHSTLKGQLSEMEADACPAPLQSHAADVFSNNSAAQGHQNVNDELVEAISRNIAQQLQMLSLKNTTVRGRSDTQQPLSWTSDSLENESRPPSHREALNRFTQELQRYAEQSGAKGKLPIPTPTPPRSSTSLHTIAALLPFRSEFKAAGLAITSKDQKKRPSHRSPVGKNRATMNQAPPSHAEQQHILQMDGNAGCTSSSTEIPFPVSKDMNEFRYAMVDQPKPHKYRRKKLTQKPKPLYSESLSEKVLTGPTAKLPRPRMHTYPEWPNVTSLERRSNQRKNLDKRKTKSTSPAVRSTLKTRQSNRAFFTGRGTPMICSSVSLESVVQDKAGTSSNKHHPRVKKDVYAHRNCSQGNEEESPCIRPVQTSRDIKQAISVQPRPRSCHSLSADVLVPQQFHATKKSSKPLPELPHPDSTSTTTEQSCRLSVEDVSPSTPKKDLLDKGKARVSLNRGTKYGSSSISPNHITVCSRGFSGRKIGRPNVPKRTSSIRSLRAANQDYDQDGVLDRDVLRGLHIASSAACNEQIDSFIHEKTGLHIRQFLADLMPLESLGNEPVRESKGKRSRRRRSDIREAKRRVRKSRQMRERAMV
ncbi:uncharacterized protein FFB20_04577 [Fusarium fujikuroi]|uniref:Uncharacterized protein n=1 Tax=Gibberella fujikuroi (strain CBS 195.34 / IMI 58289 / NRRL A-6831) TaxID=1279085 RepID=S0DL19_GIBF5|nr:uncharacterized protein FFUJ_01457 [Fusarium fujikuroi IMI 58289]SCN68344.1 uncharacterized protein FFE2_01556 [Fusarium fujikuroi]CCT62032.1 uncharacterized protein FFUJ_01457 [Fusarium fujikuroi IMI 58289]SCN72582.1 uncharacterized protein FFC1_01550 [Fusarium fujikuroi]SCN74563.1 uncharacterized protein FFB20_04577 [Fusarium fujikuroi]SCN75696.1 uncharacterized protein FFM5_01503 [Fusarium fujikuroi]